MTMTGLMTIGLRTMAHAQAQEAREQAQRIREQAQQTREQAERIRQEVEQAREEAMRDVRVIRVPPRPPPGQDPQIVIHPRGPWDQPGIPPEAVDIFTIFAVCTAAVLILRPLMRAFANRFERRGTPTALPPEVTAHMERLEHAIEAVAIEVERISEGQRYTTKLLSERVGKGG